MVVTHLLQLSEGEHQQILKEKDAKNTKVVMKISTAIFQQNLHSKNRDLEKLWRNMSLRAI